MANSEVLQPAALAELIKGSNPPTVICTAFPVLYHLKHISHASFAGPDPNRKASRC